MAKHHTGKHWKVKDTSKMKGRVPWNKGTARTQECVVCGEIFRVPLSYVERNISCCSKKCKGEMFKGTSNPSWKGGKADWWTREVKKRDNNTCQVCGLYDPDPGFMEANHIVEKSKRSDLRHDVNNGETLCPNCHKRKTLSFKRTSPKTQAKLKELYAL